MTPIPSNLFEHFDLDLDQSQQLTQQALDGSDDGELFLEYRVNEAIGFDNGKIRTSSYNIDQGFGMRAIFEDRIGYAHSSSPNLRSLRRAADSVRSVKSGYQGTYSDPPQRTNKHLYSAVNPISDPNFKQKIQLLYEIDAYLRQKDHRVYQVSVSLGASYQHIEILRKDGFHAKDMRPLVSLSISVVTEINNRRESGACSMGGRESFHQFINPTRWKNCADDALKQALINQQSVEAPAGEMDVVLGPGWPGILLHEAVGHGLEGDYNRKQSSAFSHLLGQRIASKGVYVVDDGTINKRRGSLTIDDEGTPSAKNTLIEDGILVGYMQDRQNARLMNMKPTGNGRRQSYAHVPMPRMTNTYMLNGEQSPEDLIKSVKKGLYAVNFGGGQVDIISGKFVFSCTEAYRIDDGKIGAPVKGAMLIGNGPDALTRIKAIGNDMSLDPGMGTCGKSGQSVPVGVGQPSIRIDGLTVGGTAV